jgi:dienelactone hydrolase
MIMRLLRTVVSCLAMALVPAAAHAETARHPVTVPTTNGEILVETFGNCAHANCPAVLILSGSRGFEAPVYDQIGETFRAAGLNLYLVHILSEDDLRAIAQAGGAQARIAYHVKRLPHWISAIDDVVAYLEKRQSHSGKVGILGVSLGAQIASAASIGKPGIDALVMVDGGLPNGYARHVKSLPPLLLIWGSADKVFPLSVARDLQLTAQKLGTHADLDVYENGQHDFFLQSGTPIARSAHESAARFLMERLSD